LICICWSGNVKYTPRYRQKQAGNRFRHTVNENTLLANEGRQGDANLLSPSAQLDMPMILIDAASSEHLPSAHLASVSEDKDAEKGQEEAVVPKGVTSLRSRFFAADADDPPESVQLLSMKPREEEESPEHRRGHFTRQQHADTRNESV